LADGLSLRQFHLQIHNHRLARLLLLLLLLLLLGAVEHAHGFTGATFMLKTVEPLLEDFNLVLQVRDLVTLSIDLTGLKVELCGFLLLLCQLEL